MDFSHGTTRPAAVAGNFYPGHPDDLVRLVDGYLAQARPQQPAEATPPKALIVPHAGLIYSGPVAACAYVHLAPLRQRVRRVVLFGPAHRVWVPGLAVPTAGSFDGPLGAVTVDPEAVARLLALPFVQRSDEAHAAEHSLEVQLPFLQRLLDDFTLVPVVVGGAEGDQVAEALDAVWGGDDTLVVISSDLSHYEGYEQARRHDLATCQAIVELRAGALQPEDACGCRGVDGLLRVARSRGLAARTVDLRNSGDTAGPRDQVVGYGAWLFAAAATPDAEGLDENERGTLLGIAGRSVQAAAQGHGQPAVDLAGVSSALQAPGAAFVTVQVDGALRGCLGSLEAHRPLADDVAVHAYAAASEDPRFDRLGPDELPGAAVEVAVLGRPQAMRFRDQADLLAQLRPGRDGLVLWAGRNRGTFLPKVWDNLPEPADFLSQLKRKAGLPADYWSDEVQVSRYTTQSFAAPLTALLN